MQQQVTYNSDVFIASYQLPMTNDQ